MRILLKGGGVSILIREDLEASLNNDLSVFMFFTANNIDRFRSLLESTDWNHILNCQNPNTAYLLFNEIWKNILN